MKEIKEIEKHKLLTTAQAAKILGLVAGTLQNQRTQRTGLPYVKIGGKVFYDPSDIIDYIKNNKIYPLD